MVEPDLAGEVDDGRIPGERVGITAEQLVDRMNREGIDKSVVLPIESPEVCTCLYTTEQVRETPMTDEMRAAIVEGNARPVFNIKGAV
ncbi:MAG: hypothetical protein ACOCX2_14640 [Armatimonadota bacterium]